MKTANSPLIFLASAEALKPVILINSFYDSIDRDSAQDYLLTDAEDGKTCDMARRHGMHIIVTKDVRFQDKSWINTSLRAVRGGVLVSCGWPYKIPAELINVFSTAINCHGSYLPDYRGSRSYMHYWANCSDHYGAAIHYLNENFDDGNVIVRAKYRQFTDESHDIIFWRTAELCGHLLPTALALIELGYKGWQPGGTARYFFKRTPEEFELHRKNNDKKRALGMEPVLTAHKMLR